MNFTGLTLTFFPEPQPEAGEERSGIQRLSLSVELGGDGRAGGGRPHGAAGAETLGTAAAAPAAAAAAAPPPPPCTDPSTGRSLTPLLVLLPLTVPGELRPQRQRTAPARVGPGLPRAVSCSVQEPEL